jgi:hypothetical protein
MSRWQAWRKWRTKIVNIRDLKDILTMAEQISPSEAVCDAITVYMACKAEIDAYAAVVDAAKKLISDAMAEMGETAYATKAGKATVTAPSVSVTYDSKALDALAASNDAYARLLSPHRKVTERAGTLRIVGAK